MIYKFRCLTCNRVWEADVSHPSLVKCNGCNRVGTASTVTFKKKRSDAIRRGRLHGANDLNVHSRPIRQIRTPIALATQIIEGDLPGTRGIKRPRDDASDADDTVIDVGAVQDTADSEYLPAPDFSIEMRFSSGGSFAMSRIVTARTQLKANAWIGIAAPAGRGSTAAQFGGMSATDYARQYIPGTREDYEWCHMVADSLGGATTQANLFCATYHANTAMLCIERVLRGRTDLEVRLEVDVRAGTDLGERIVYRIRRQSVQPATKRRRTPSGPSSVTEFAATIDALATGCTAVDGMALTGRVRAWLPPAPVGV